MCVSLDITHEYLSTYGWFQSEVHQLQCLLVLDLDMFWQGRCLLIQNRKRKNMVWVTVLLIKFDFGPKLNLTKSTGTKNTFHKRTKKYNIVGTEICKMIRKRKDDKRGSGIRSMLSWVEQGRGDFTKKGPWYFWGVVVLKADKNCST